jgi:predicted DNA-binding transcriptional regulator AlpA
MFTHPIDRFQLPAAVHNLPPKAAADLLGCSYKTLQAWRNAGIGPAWVKLGPRRIAYTLADIQAWLAANRQSNVA